MKTRVATVTRTKAKGDAKWCPLFKFAVVRAVEVELVEDVVVLAEVGP